MADGDSPSITRSLSKLAMLMAEKLDLWNEECLREGKEASIPALQLNTKHSGHSLVVPGEPVVWNPSVEMLSRYQVVHMTVHEDELLQQLLKGERSPQVALHAGEMELDGEAMAGLFITQLFAEL